MGEGNCEGNFKLITNDEWTLFFEARVREAFEYLSVRFGFVYCGVGVALPECWASYDSSKTRVTIVFELGSGPRVELERKSANVLGLRKDRYDMAFLLMERAPEKYTRSEIVDLDDPRLRSELQLLAELLETYGGDILQGDFAVFPRLRERAAENLRSADCDLYGE